MSVDTRTSVLLGTRAVVTPAEADLWISILVLPSAFALSFRCVRINTNWNVWKVVFECFLSVFSVFLAPHEVMNKLPEPIVGTDGVGLGSIEPE